MTVIVTVPLVYAVTDRRMAVTGYAKLPSSEAVFDAKLIREYHTAEDGLNPGAKTSSNVYCTE